MANIEKSIRTALAAGILLITLTVATGCTASSSGEAGMEPDYRGVTIPCNVAPLNFRYTGTGRVPVTRFSAGNVSVTIRGNSIRWKLRKWRKLLATAAGDSIRIESSILGHWSVAVSRDSIDRYLTYRLIEPGYEVWDRVEIKERDISTFEERTLCDWRHTGNACMNCHIHKGDRSIFHIRGKGGGTILGGDTRLRKVNLVNDGMSSPAAYGDLHPDGRWGVFSSNTVIPAFHTLGSRRMEVYDRTSDLTVADFESNRMLNDEEYARPDRLETFPCFSADGESVFYCVADTVELPREVTKLKYSICKASFCPRTGALGHSPETVWDADSNNASACHPKASPDGKWLMFTRADYGTFPIWHRECDLGLIDLRSGKEISMATVNSNVSDTYHSWSSNSKWFVFASKREDGQYGKPFICHIDGNGVCSKPFILPQRDPRHYERTLKSYNVPDLGTVPAPYDAETTGALHKIEAEKFD